MPLHSILALSVLAALACVPPGRGSRVGSPAPPAAIAPSDVPAVVGRYHLTEVRAIQGYPADTIYRFTDGSAARVSAIRYYVPEDVKTSQDSALWTVREGAKFALVQAEQVRRGAIESYEVAFTDTSTVDDVRLFEHAVAIAVRRNGRIDVEFQYLYLVGGRFLKARGTFPSDQWTTSEFPNFARELARRVAAAHR